MKQQTLALIGVSLLLLSNAPSATVLTFDIAGAANGSLIPQTYGDNVTATTMGSFSYGAAGGVTPNVEVTYAGQGGQDLSFWSTGYSDLTNVIYSETDGQDSYSITLIADAGFVVSLSNFDIGNFGSAVTLPSVTVTDGNGAILFSQSDISLLAAGVPHLTFNLGGAVVANELTLLINTSGLGGNSDNIGLDNVQFSQVAAVPIPAAVWLLGSALGMLGWRRRKAV